MCLYGSFVYAFDVPVTFTSSNITRDVSISLPDYLNENNLYYFIYHPNNMKDRVRCYITDVPIIFNNYINDNNNVSFTLNLSNDGHYFGFYIYHDTDDSPYYSIAPLDFDKFSTYEALQTNFVSRIASSYLNEYSYNSSDFNDFISSSYCNYNIKDSNNNIIIQKKTTVQPQGIIAPQIQETEMEKTQAEIIQILPVVLVVLVGIIAIRKGIAMIRAFLQKS